MAVLLWYFPYIVFFAVCDLGRLTQGAHDQHSSSAIDPFQTPK